MELLGAPASPFVRMARMVAWEAGLKDELAFTVVTTTALETDARLAAVNPLGKIPALIRPSGAALYDSRVICRFLNDQASAGLYPDARLWEVLTLEATAHGMAEAAVLMVYERRLRPEVEQSEAWIAAQWEKVTRALDAVEARWMSHLGGPLDASHIALAATLGYLDFRHGARDWRLGRPALAAWFQRAAEWEAFVATAPA
ncbi:MAG: glutathione S-transferase [Pseudomonadota bacterium]